MGKSRSVIKTTEARSKPTKARCAKPAISEIVWVENDAKYVFAPYPSNFLPTGYRRSFVDVAFVSEPQTVPAKYDAEHFRLNLNHVVSNAISMLEGPWIPHLPFTAAFLIIALYLQFYYDTIGGYCSTKQPYDSDIEDLAFLANDAPNFYTFPAG